MITAYLNALHEGIARRVALVLMGFGVLAGVAFNGIVHVRHLPNGASTMFLGSQSLGAPSIAAPHILDAEVSAVGGLWVLSAVFTAATLLASTLEKGWLELVFSKGTPRWRVYLGRFFGGATLYSLTFLLATFPLAFRLWWQTGVATWPLAVALAIQTLGFISILSVAALVSLPQKGVALPIMASVALWFFSPLLARRQQYYYPLLSSHLARGLIDWAYRILPKCSELDRLCSSFILDHKIASWWPLWSTGVFAFVVLAVTLWRLEQKSF